MSHLDYISPWTFAVLLAIVGIYQIIGDTGQPIFPLLGAIGWAKHALTQYRSYRIEHT